MVAHWLLLLLAAAAPQGGVESARQHLERGYALGRQGDLNGAEAEFRAALRLSPNDALVLAGLGMALCQPGRLEEADGYLERALKLAPNDVHTRYTLAFNQVQLGKLEAGRENLSRVLEAEPGHAGAKELLARLEVRAGYDAALAEYGRGRYAQSQALLEQMIAGGSRDARVYRLLAWCRHRRGDSQEALAAIHKALELAPGDAAYFVDAGQMMLEQHQFHWAYAAVQKALELDAGNTRAMKTKGLVELARGEPKQARDSFQRVVERDPADAEALTRLADAQRASFAYGEAAATLEKGMARFPGNARMHEAYGRLLLDPGSHPDAAAEARAVAALEKALALDGRLPVAHYELGKLLVDDGKAAEGAKHLETAAKLEPRDAATHLALADAYRLMGRGADQARELRLYREMAALKGK